MNKVLFKDSIKEIKNTYKRFLSLFLMAFLGVGFFAGLRATSPDMLDTIDNYYDEQNVYDIQILSTLGLTQDDLDELAQIENVEDVKGCYQTDGIINTDDNEIVAEFITVSNINEVNLLSGSLPQNSNECVVEEDFLTDNDLEIGDIINVTIEDTTNDEGETISYLKENELTIVGTVKSPLYISRSRGTSDLGAGSIEYYVYISEDNINNTDFYTSIYITVENAKDYVTSSDEYEDYIEEVEGKIEEIKEEREQARYDELVEIAETKLQDAEDEFNKEKEEGETEIAEAETEISDAKKQIEDTEKEIEKSKSEANKKFAEAESQINDAEQEIETNEQELSLKEETANSEFEELENTVIELQTNLEQVTEQISTLQEKYNEITTALLDSELTDEQIQNYETSKSEIEANLLTLTQNKETLESTISQIQTEIENGKQEIETAKAQIQAAKDELQKQIETLSATKKSTYVLIQSAESELEEQKEKLQSAEEELNTSKQEFEEKIADAEEELLDAKEEISEIENATWYILDRNSNEGYVSFIQDAQSIENISKVFPAVFFIVAALISLTSMTRMVEEKRLEIGTLKALRIQ